MLRTLVRAVLAFTVGGVASLALVVAVEVVSAVRYPFPEGVDPSDPAVCVAHVARMPAEVLGIAVAGWGLTAFTGAWLATLLGAGRHRAHGFVLGALLLAAALLNMSMLPYPGWFWAANLITLPLATWLGAWLGGRPRQPALSAG